MKKIEIIHQHDTMQYGIACLQMVCKYESANTLGLHTTCVRATTMTLSEV